MRTKFIFVLFFTLLIAVTPTVFGQTTIFDYGSSWKYLDDGSDQGTAWRGSSFSDASWSSGTGYFGYGDAWINTCVNAGAGCPAPSGAGCVPGGCDKYVTTYFRKVVNISDPAAYSSFVFSAYRDDGIVVYVNGVEVWREHMPTGTILYNTFASSPEIGGSDETTAVSQSIPSSYFVAGNNTIEVEVHQQRLASSDVTFNMKVVGQPAPILAFGSVWKYLDNGTNQSTAWTGTSFNDASWASGGGYLGYGDTWITTCLKAGASCSAVCSPPSCTKYVTDYFRRIVNIPDPSLYDYVNFNVYRDDGVVVYVNGVEVWREHMPTGTITYTTLASSPEIGGTGETTPVNQNIPISYFVAGNNTIAVEVHQQSTSSSDVTFNMELTGVPHVPPAITQGPYLQMGNKTAVTVRWRTNVPCKSRVMAGTVLGTYPIVVSDPALVTEHELRLTGLSPDTKYFYQLGTDAEIIQGDLNNFFVTAPADDATRRVTMAVFGDCGRNDNNFQTGSLSSYQTYLTSQGLKAADLMLIVGDNAYDAGTDAEFSANFFSRYSGNILKNHILFPAPGNHDYANNASRQNDHAVPYYDLFTMPSAGQCGGVASNTEAYYSYDWGNVHVLSLDSYGKEGNTTRLYDTNGAQVTWVKNDLAANNKKWTIVYFHHPPFTMGSHNSDGESELSSIRNNFIRILERYGVDMIICGHSHDYERSYLLKNYYGNEASFNIAAHTADASSAQYNGTSNSCPYVTQSGKFNHGTVYVVSGSAGADGGVQSGYPHNAFPFSIDDGGMFFLDIKDNRLDAKFIRRNSTIADQFTILKDVKVQDTVKVFPGTPVALNSTWEGGHVWNTGETTRSITFTSDVDTMITVRDSANATLSNTCIIDKHYIDIQCTIPAFTVFPSNVTKRACDNIYIYAVEDTATPTPVLTYAFSGATTGSGAGSGSGSSFNAGTTIVTLTATNTCGPTSKTFTVTVDPLPAPIIINGDGTHCGQTTLTASNGGDGTIYFQGIISGGTSTLTPSTSQSITSSETYYFRALGADGCWGAAASANVVINPLPVVTFTAQPSPTICANTNVTYTTQAGMSSYVWMIPGISGTDYSIVSGASSNSVTLKWLKQGTKTLTVNYTDGNLCSAVSPAASTPVFVQAEPAAISGNSQLCTGGSTIILANTSANGVWSGGVTGIAIVNSATGVVTSGTTQGTAIISYSNGCGSATSITATVNATPAPISGNVPLCANGSSITLANTASNGSWSGGTPGIATINSVGNVTSGTNSGRAVFNYANGCGAFATATVTVNPLPLVHTFTGGGGYCAGVAGVNVGLTLTESGIAYQLYRGATPVGIPMNGTGSAIDFGVQSIPGVYSALAANMSTGCTSTLPGVTVNVNSLPDTFTVTGGGSYCATGAGVHIGLTGSAAGVKYQLYNGSVPAGSPVLGTGSVLDFGSQTAAGTYSVAATNATTHCVSNMAGNTAVAVLPMPNNYTVTGGGAYCAGDTGVHVKLNGSDTGIKYQLYRGVTTVGAPLSGTAAAIDFGRQITAGTYSVVATNAVTGCSKNMGAGVTISVNPLPANVYNTTGGGAYCTPGAGVHIGLTNSATGFTYRLSRAGISIGSSLNGINAALDFGSVTVGGIYKVFATDPGTGCRKVMNDSAMVTPVSFVVPSVDIYTGSSKGSVICPGTPVTFTALTINGGSVPGYAWSVNGAAVGTSTGNYMYTPANGDMVKVKLHSTAQCAAPDTASGMMIVNIDTTAAPSVFIKVSPVTTIAIGQPDTLTAIAVNCGSSPKYQWYKNSTKITGATNMMYTSNNFANHDSISCRVLANNVCNPEAVNSVIITVYNVGISTQSFGDKIILSPNPNKGSFTISGTFGTIVDEELVVEITNMFGQVVYKNKATVSNGAINERIQLSSNVANGMYLLNLHSVKGNTVLRFVIE